MKKRTVALCLLAAMLAGLLSGCGGLGGRDSKQYFAGVWNGDHYDSAFMDLRFTLPEGWTASSEEELSDMSAAADRALDLQTGGSGENPKSFYHYELSAKDPETGAGVLVIVSTYTLSTTDYISSLQAGAEAEGAAYTAGDSLNLDLAGRRFLAISLTMEGQEAPYQRQYVRKEGDNLINVMLFTPDEGKEAFATLEGLFTKLS